MPIVQRIVRSKRGIWSVLRICVQTLFTINHRVVIARHAVVNVTFNLVRACDRKSVFRERRVRRNQMRRFWKIPLSFAWPYGWYDFNPTTARLGAQLHNLQISINYDLKINRNFQLRRYFWTVNFLLYIGHLESDFGTRFLLRRKCLFSRNFSHINGIQECLIYWI